MENDVKNEQDEITHVEIKKKKGKKSTKNQKNDKTHSKNYVGEKNARSLLQTWAKNNYKHSAIIEWRIGVTYNAIETQKMQMQMFSIRDTIRPILEQQHGIPRHEHQNILKILKLVWENELLCLHQPQVV
jgi:hypothetical protein